MRWADLRYLTINCMKHGLVFPGGDARTAAEFAREADHAGRWLARVSQSSPSGAFHSVLKVNLRLCLSPATM